MNAQPMSSQTPLRRAARLCSAGAAVVLVTGGTLLSAPAVADVPEGWSDPDPVNNLHALLLLAGLPLLLFVAITLAVYLPAMARGERLGPGAAEPDTEWFGGPSRGSRELAAPDDDNSAAGGSRGSW